MPSTLQPSLGYGGRPRNTRMSEAPAQTIHMPTLDQLLAFEETWLGKTGDHKGEAIRRDLGIPPARYFQLLGRAIDTREALELNPMLVRRLRRMRDARGAERARRVS